ncbi:ATP-binding cassette domain-containing protein [Geminisphaera colitermitum]|uniref:ATP-binding cassette domain-containing protein n=1 Tax=Geminisphaera colitermitum TaxID=1148786 RepID=UPI00019650BA|nr:ATP-binding cassette domain-containing protein [Geminisphaera colitermitum]
MALLTLLDVSHAFGGPLLLDHINFQVDPGERVCLVGRNGAGKSTLMKLIAGDMKPDKGEIFRQPGAHFARLTQEIPAEVNRPGSVHDFVAAGLRPASAHEEDWEQEIRLEQLLDRMQLPAAAEVAQLSGGLKRRVLLARALASAPDLLLLDEPTNHLDLASILWLEEFLLNEKTGLFFVTHDRAFLRKLAGRIVELDRGVLTNWACPYDTFLVRRQERLEAEERQQAATDKKLAQEEEWARRQPSARRTKAVARLEQLAALRAERRNRRARTGTATIRVTTAAESGVKVIEAENLSFAWPSASVSPLPPPPPPLLRDFTATITRGDKIGLIGPNGAGKTTFIKLLLGQLQPTGGILKHGTQLEVVYLDQLRAQIDDAKSVADNVADGNTTVTVAGKTKHVISYLQDFLFEPERARTPARVLSGGERNRLLLARLFTKPANVLVLDEPTNDLDAETLELLENLLVEFDGTLIVVSHDRAFLDEVVTSVYVFEGEGRVTEYVGGYSDWQAELARKPAGSAESQPGIPGGAPSRRDVRVSRKLTNKEKAELAALPGRIEKLETEQAELTARLADPVFYQREPGAAAAVRVRLEEIEVEHAAAFARWEELEALA